MFVPGTVWYAYSFLILTGQVFNQLPVFFFSDRISSAVLIDEKQNDVCSTTEAVRMEVVEG
jgi:hypothetical protein